MRSFAGTRLFGFVALAALFAAPAGSIVYDVPTDAELVAQTPLIVYGRVEYTAPAPNGNFTDATVRIERVLKGVGPGSTVVVRQEGGRGLVVMGLPMLRRGDRALLFLNPGPDGVYRTVSMGLGIFFEDRGHLVRHDVPDDGFRHAERFVRWIEERGIGLARPADYRVEEIPGPRLARQEANWITAVNDVDFSCEGEDAIRGTFLRWAQWDSGFSRIRYESGECCAEPELSTKVTVTEGDLTAEQALTMTDAAAAMWNADSGSRVRVPAGTGRDLDLWLNLRGTSIDSFIGVEYGGKTQCTVQSVRPTYDWNGEKPVFQDRRTHNGAEVAVAMIDENGAETHSATNSYRCLKVSQTPWSTGGTPNPGDALCTTHEGAYTPVGTVEILYRLVCQEDPNVLGSTSLYAACDHPRRRSTLHSIPGGGGQAYRIGYAHVIVSKSAMRNADANKMQAIVAHELGHALGIAHPAPGIAAVMSAQVNTSYTSLQPDDQVAVRKLYPVASSGSSPPSEPEPEPEPPASDCTLVAPYWSGPTGGFTVRPAPDRNSVSLTCGGRTTEYMAEGGIVTRLVESSCRRTGLQLTGAAPGGWYWQHGDRNAAVAPLVCSDALGGPSAVVPGGVTVEATDDGTLIRHDTARLIGIVPHLAGNDCGEYVTPYWQGDGGVVVWPAEGRETVRVRVQCGSTWSTMTPSAGEDGVISELVEKGYCTDDEGNPKQGRLTVTGAAPGGWYWIQGEANAAVGPLMCADLLGGPGAVDPGGVNSQATDDGTYVEHEVDRLIGVVPHLAPKAEDE